MVGDIFYNAKEGRWENPIPANPQAIVPRQAITPAPTGPMFFQPINMGGAPVLKSFSLGDMGLPSTPMAGLEQMRALSMQHPAYKTMVQYGLPLLVKALDHPKVTPAMIQYGVNLFNNALAQYVQQEAIKRQLIGNMISSLTKEYEILAEMARTADPATKVAISKKLEDLTVQRNKLLETMGIPIETPKATGQTQETSKQGIPTPKRAPESSFDFVYDDAYKDLDSGTEISL